MCIIYFADHQGCKHRHFLGSFNCGFNCPVDSRHMFHVEDSGGEHDCTTCVLLKKGQPGPVVVPVEYYPPAEEVNVEVTQGYGMQKVKKVEEEQGKMEETMANEYQHNAASLSDVDSVTSEWRQDYTARGQEQTLPVSDHLHPNEGSPNARAHRNLVQDQLSQLPTHLIHQRQARYPDPHLPVPPMPFDPLQHAAGGYNDHTGSSSHHVRTMSTPGEGIPGQAPSTPYAMRRTLPGQPKPPV